MQILEFKAPSKNGLNFSPVATFDDHSFPSGKKYRVVKHCITKSKQNGERDGFESSTSPSILKAVSYITEIAPLIMSVGKLIGDSLYHFFIDEQEGTRVLPPLDQDAQNRNQDIQKFKQQATNTFKQATFLTSPCLECSLTPEQKNSLEQANNHRFGKHLPLQEISMVRGGVHFVFFLESLPGFVFKPMDDQKAAERYVEIAEKARHITLDNNFYLLHVPESKVIEINGTYFVMQEKADLIGDGYYEQKGVYQCCWNDIVMEGYMKEVFSQLIQFVCISHFRDVKYDNIPLTGDGRVALIDLDENSAIEGLTRGCAGKHDGLFSYIPAKYIDYFIEIAKTTLTKGLHQQFELKMATIKARAEKKAKQAESYHDFAQKNSISIPSQLINPDLPILFKDEDEQEFAKFIVESINNHLSQSKNFSVQIGRITALGISIFDQLNEKALSLWGPTLPFLSFQGEVSFTFILNEILEGLKKAGYIYKYKIDQSYDYVKINC